MNIASSRLFTWRQILILAVTFAGTVVLYQRGQRYVCENLVAFDCPYYWPVSIFSLRFPTVADLLVAAIVTAVFLLAMRYLEANQYRLWLLPVFGILLIAGLSLIHGVEIGYYTPIAGDARSGVLIPYSTTGQEYYHDALTITDPADFFRRYNEIQPTLHAHAHTHPPGAVLTFYFLKELLRDPGLIAFFIMLVSVIATVFFFYRLMLTEVSGETARYMAFLIVLVPAIQIYYLASLDALITALLTGTLYLFCFGSGRKAVAGAVVMLSSSFLLTFVSLFILPVLVGFDLIVKRSLKRSVIVIGSLIAIYTLVYFLTGYNAVQSFRTASLYENPRGFMLFVDPVNYMFTRIEDVAEIIFFFGPFLLVILMRGLKGLKFRPLNVLTVLGCVTLLAMYATGAWRTGETARACAFIYPFLLFPVGRYLDEINAGPTERWQLASLVFLQSVGLQIIGNYHW